MHFSAVIAAVFLSSLPVMNPPRTPPDADAPVFWETPVSRAAPGRTRDEWAIYPPETAAKITASLAINIERGNAEAIDFLKSETDPLLVERRAWLRYLARDYDGAQSDYERVLASGDRGVARSLALAGYQATLEARASVLGDLSAYGPLIKSLKDEWRNEAALSRLPDIYARPGLPKETRDFIRQQEPILNLRLGRFDRAAELLSKPLNGAEVKWLAQAETRRGNFKKAAELRLGLALKAASGRARAAEMKTAFLTLARGGLFEEALSLAERCPEIKAFDGFAWHLGLAALMAGERRTAREHFEAVIQDNAQLQRRQAARYFLARALEMDGRRAEARLNYKKAAEGPFSYYRLLALGRLSGPGGKNLDAPMARLLEPGPPGRDCDSLGYHLWISEKGLGPVELEEAADALAALGNLFEASSRSQEAFDAAFVDALTKRDWQAAYKTLRRHEAWLTGKNMAVKPAAGKTWLPVAATVAARAGDYRLAVRLLSRVKSGPPSNGLKRWSHPLVYSREILAAHRQYGLSPQLLLALIRTESAYQPDVISASNARGLMQLLPATADKINEILEPGPAEQSSDYLSSDYLWLFDPGLNISRGAWYLNELIQGFGDVALALAGYNGGPYNIKSLIEAKPGQPIDLFIETLPFEETGRYVKKIMESRYIYEYVYLGEAALPDLTGPAAAPKASLPAF
ncbi:MAG: lytic transglycosylase domain-containing protein [Candidatus Adiutrix sp.]|jgi:soluble lytic murein transglycosylase-like protein|nr:lytic transglycosylase domain-containing protein [Candidatus Adiutrix sp.]